MLHPETWVVDGEGEPRDGHGAKNSSPDQGPQRFRESRLHSEDPRLDATTLVLGVERDGRQRAYRLSAVHDAGGIVDDTIDDCPIVVVARPGWWLALAFERAPAGQRLEFDWSEPSAADSPPRLVDRGTGSRWDLWGCCVEGPLLGERLTILTCAVRRWSGWTSTNPGSELWGAATSSA